MARNTGPVWRISRRLNFSILETEEVLANTKNEGLIGTFVDVEQAAKEVEHICNTYNRIDIDFRRRI